jgi:aspartate aminotransferase
MIQPHTASAPAIVHLASHLTEVEPSVISQTIAAVTERKRHGHPVLGLHVGEPDFDTPTHIKDAAVAAIRANDTRYTAMDGSPALKAAIQLKVERDSGLGFEPSEIAAAAGAKMLIFAALFATLDPGDEVILSAPYFGSYVDIVRMMGASPVVLQSRPKDGFRLTADALQSAITPNTRWLMINSPSNPSGAVYQAEHYAPVLDVVARNPQVWLMADDIYEHLVYDDVAFVTPLQVRPELRDRTLTINGVSKAYAMTGWRIGYATGPERLMRAIGAVISQSTSCPCSIAQAAAVEALRGPQDAVEAYRQQYARRRELVVQGLNAIPHLDCVAPGGAMYAFAHWGALAGSSTPTGQRLDTDEQFCQYLLQGFDVAVIPGAAFGTPGHFRLSFAVAPSVLEDALARLRAACASLDPAEPSP